MTEFFRPQSRRHLLFYGLAFFSMGLAIWLASSRFARQELRLAGALLFWPATVSSTGCKEWFDMFRLLDERGSTLIPPGCFFTSAHLTHLVISSAVGVQHPPLLPPTGEGENGDRLALLGAGGFPLLWSSALA